MAFVIEIYRPGLTAGSAADLVAQVREAIEREATLPGSVRYAGSTVAPDDEVCFVRLEGGAREAVDALVVRLGLADARVTELVDLEAD